jgi:hypothetical protein
MRRLQSNSDAVYHAGQTFGARRAAILSAPGRLVRRPREPAKETDPMRYMMLMIPGGYSAAPPDAMPSAEAVAAMARYNEELRVAGVLLGLEGLHPPSAGARVSFKGGKPLVTDGPFAETKEVLGGYWMIDVPSQADAIAWARRCPAAENDVIEIRRVQEISDFPEDVRKAAERRDP